MLVNSCSMGICSILWVETSSLRKCVIRPRSLILFLKASSSQLSGWSQHPIVLSMFVKHDQHGLMPKRTTVFSIKEDRFELAFNFWEFKNHCQLTWCFGNFEFKNRSYKKIEYVVWCNCGLVMVFGRCTTCHLELLEATLKKHDNWKWFLTLIHSSSLWLLYDQSFWIVMVDNGWQCGVISRYELKAQRLLQLCRLKYVLFDHHANRSTWELLGS